MTSLTSSTTTTTATTSSSPITSTISPRPREKNLRDQIALTGALLSCICSASALIIIVVIYSRERIHAREMLVISLLLAGFISSTNIAFSASLVSSGGGEKKLEAGASCTINGFLGIVGAQAGDLSNLCIALVTCYVLKAHRLKCSLKEALRRVGKRLPLMIVFIWTIPTLSATIGLTVLGYEPRGSWCWLPSTPRTKALIVRYLLYYGPRMIIILIIMAVYTKMMFELLWKRSAGAGSNNVSACDGGMGIANTGGGNNIMQVTGGGGATGATGSFKSSSGGSLSSITPPSAMLKIGAYNTVGRKLSSSTSRINNMDIINTAEAVHLDHQQQQHYNHPYALNTINNNNMIANGTPPPVTGVPQYDTHILQHKKSKRAMHLLLLYPSIYILLCGAGVVFRAYADFSSDFEHMDRKFMYFQSFRQFIPMIDAIIYTATLRVLY